MDKPLDWKQPTFIEWVKQNLVAVKQKAIKQTTQKTKHLNFVYLFDSEYNQLIEWYWESKVKDLIARMNDYIGSKWDKYKSHYHTALSWFNQKGIKKLEKRVEEQKKAEELWKPSQLISEEKKKEILDKMNKLKQGFKL